MQLGLDDPLALVEAINEFFQLLFFYHGSTRIFGTTDISVDSWQEDEEWGRKTVLSRLTLHDFRLPFTHWRSQDNTK